MYVFEKATWYGIFRISCIRISPWISSSHLLNIFLYVKFNQLSYMKTFRLKGKTKKKKTITSNLLQYIMILLHFIFICVCLCISCWSFSRNKQYKHMACKSCAITTTLSSFWYVVFVLYRVRVTLWFCWQRFFFLVELKETRKQKHNDWTRTCFFFLLLWLNKVERACFFFGDSTLSEQLSIKN